MVGGEPEFQGQGVGRMLIQECADRAKATGCSGIGLDTEDEKNVQIYLKCGFEVFAERRVDDLPIYVMWRQF
jgi:GNAT superfamily N-acetyltransferase